jgi:hypothetical protein
MGFFRASYLSEVVFESELIQRRLAGGSSETRTEWLDRLFSAADSAIGLESAYAGPTPNPCNLNCAPYDSLCMIRQSQCAENQLLQQMASFNQNLQQYSPQFIKMNKNWADTNQQLGQMNKNWAETNAEYKRTNDMLAQFMDPGHAFAWAMESAAGAALGVAAVSIGIDLLSMGGKAIYEAITGEEEHKAIIEKFNNAKDLWTTTSKAAADLEKSIDALLFLKQTEKLFGISRADVINKTNYELAIKRSQLRNASAKLDELTGRNDGNPTEQEAECIKVMGGRAAVLTGEIDVLQRKLEQYEKADDDNTMCKKLKDGMMALRAMEDKLQDARGAILRGQDDWGMEFSKGIKAAEGDFEFARNNNETVHAHEQARAEKEYKEAKRKQYEWKRDWIMWCEGQKASDVPVVGWTSQIPVVGGWRFGFEKECQGEFMDKHYRTFQQNMADIDFGYLKDKQSEQARYDIASSNSSKLWFDYRTKLAARSDMREWFTQLERDQICLHDENNCTGASQEGLVMSRFEHLAKMGEDIGRECVSYKKPANFN